MSIHKKRIRLAVCAILTGILFLVIGSAYDQSWLLAFDDWVQGYVYDSLGSSGRTACVVITYLGSAYVSYPIMVILVCVLLVQKRYWLAFLSGLSLLGVRVCNWMLKAVFERPRPELAHLVQVSSDSFPSGHAMNSIAFFGFLAFLASQVLKSFAKSVVWVWVSAAVLVGLISISRIYLGVHYPSDVAGGLLAGGAWLFFSIFLYTYVPDHEHIKQPVRASAHNE